MTIGVAAPEALEMIPVDIGGADVSRAEFRTADPDLALLTDCLQLAGGGVGSAAPATLLARFGGLSGVLAASVEALAATPGMDERRAVAIHRLHALSLRLLAAKISPRDVISSWSALLEYLRAALQHERREQFRVLFLDHRNGLLRDEQLGRGTLNHAPVYPREVIRRALELNAANLILVHNHPGGDPTPSSADVDMTRQVVEAAAVMGIGVHDHVVVGRGSVASLRTLGLLSGGRP